jgi:hypothetical protein
MVAYTVTPTYNGTWIKRRSVFLGKQAGEKECKIVSNKGNSIWRKDVRVEA